MALQITEILALQALDTEIGKLDRHRVRLDESLLKRMDEIEAARKQVEVAQAAVDEAEKALKIVRRRYEKEEARIEAALEEHSPARERLAKALEPDVLRR